MKRVSKYSGKMAFNSYKAIYTSHTIISAIYKINLDFLDRGEVISNIFSNIFT
jgi:hypothetical protein